MAFDPTELLIIAVIAVVVFLWGPQKIPELARALGRAKKEFDTASKEVTSAVTTGGAPAAPRSADEILISTARQLGIPTEGKTREQLSQEIVARKLQ
ncbi:MAG TPA: twin-arginine translocase TatA/TatE family subunit [Nitrososphaerales archaeon]|nr:twin-arginine translocase TatA/TatE family subunit [Nitrososphaerales archaeon]